MQTWIMKVNRMKKDYLKDNIKYKLSRYAIYFIQKCVSIISFIT